MAPSPKPPSRTRRDYQKSGRHERVTSGSLLLRQDESHDHWREEIPSRAARKYTPSLVAAGSTGDADVHDGYETGCRGGKGIISEGRKTRDYDQRRDRERQRRLERESRRRAARHDQGERRYGQDHNHYREDKDTRVSSRPPSKRAEHASDEKSSYSAQTQTGHRTQSASGKSKTRRRLIIAIILGLVMIFVIIIAAVLTTRKHSSTLSGKPASTTASPSSIPASSRGTYLDTSTWHDTLDFNLTYTNAAIGGLYVMGLNSTWDNGVRANPAVPALNESWPYGGTQKVHGMNIGGWLCIEPFITPSFFDQFDASDDVIDEWTYSTKLGVSAAAEALETHYSSFISEQDFADMQAAGFDHVRIPFSYWAVTTYPGDPYVPLISWRYLLRGIEWARKHGLRINLDLHGAPGSQNGWNHSGRQGAIGWLNGTDGALNAQRTIDIHKQLATFFSQLRYTNLISLYGLVNEPRMTALDTAAVMTWSQDAIAVIRAAGLPTSVPIVIGDGFLGLANWQGNALGGTAEVLLDAHQYVIFNTPQLALPHAAKLDFACQGWAQQSQQSMDPASGFGNFLCGEWSQADTDCQTYLNNVGWGDRWSGTLDTGNASSSVLAPSCPARPAAACDCAPAIADPAQYSDAYRQWLLMFAEAQMHAYEIGWGSFYWTWKTESATQWSYQLGLRAGTVPADVRNRTFDCSQAVPDFDGLGLSEAY